MHGVRTMARQRAKSWMDSFGETQTDLCNIWAAKQRAENKYVPSDYGQRKAAFQRYKRGTFVNGWKQSLLDYREAARRPRDVATPARAVKRVREPEPYSSAMPLSVSVTEHSALPPEESPATPTEAIHDWPGITAAMWPCATPLSQRDNEPLLSATPPSEEVLPADVCLPCSDASRESEDVLPADVSLQELRLVTVNVDGLGCHYSLTPKERIKKILEIITSTMPDFLLMQEVTMPMYETIRSSLGRHWKVYRRRQQSENYFNVTATKWLEKAGDKFSSRLFPSSENGRHILTVRRGPWAVMNVHAESGPSKQSCEERVKQLLLMSQSHERDDDDRVQILAGDMNARTGEDQCLYDEGWTDAWWQVMESEDASRGRSAWTWYREGQKVARYDRVYMHSSNRFNVECTHIERLTTVLPEYTDHVALHVVVRLVALTPIPASRVLPDDGEPTSNPNSTGVVEQVGPCQPSLDIPTRCLHSFAHDDLRVTDIARCAKEAAEHFRERVERCKQSPLAEKDLEPHLLPAWEDVPPLCGFRPAKPRIGGKQYKIAKDSAATGSRSRVRDPAATGLREMTKHRQDYAKWLIWTKRCGLSEEAFLSECRTTHEMDYTQDSYDSLPACLRGKQAVEEMEPSSRQVEPSSRRRGTKEPKRSNQAVDGCSRGDRCNKLEHLRRRCMARAIRDAAKDAGRLMFSSFLQSRLIREGESNVQQFLAEQADQVVEGLMSLKGARKSRIDSLQKCWQLMFDEQKLDDVQMKTLGMLKAVLFLQYHIQNTDITVNICECVLYV